MSDIDRDVVIFPGLDVIVVHDKVNNTVSVDVYDKSNKLLAGLEMRLIR